MSAISDLPKLTPGEIKEEYLCKPKNEYQRRMRRNENILTEHNCSNYGVKMQKILKLIPKNGSVNDLPINLRPKKYFNNVYARINPLRPSPTITRNFGTPSSTRCVHPLQNRALSTREGARLQGFPDKFINIGVAETSMISLCAGLAMTGLKPFAYTISTFALYRPFEMIRDDLCYQNLPVTIVGMGSGTIYSNLGPTHMSQEDISIARSIPNMQVISLCETL